MTTESQSATTAPTSPNPPNVVVILADDMGWGDLGCYGATAIPTPSMDRLAAEGIRLTNAHAASAVCTPSRYALLTGQYAWRGVLRSGVLAGHSPDIVEPGKPTIATMLRERGYATGAFGKWHLGLGWRRQDGSVRNAFTDGPAPLGRPLEQDYGFDVDYTAPFSGGPLEHGFDRFFGIAGSLDMPPYCFLDQDRTLGVPDREKEVYVAGQRPGLQTAGWRDDQVDIRLVQEACQWVRRQDGPFFCYLPVASPHYPCVPPPFIRGRSQAGSRGDAVCLVDWAVGEVLNALTGLAKLDDTLLIVTSDNGAMYGDFRSPETYGHHSNGPWRGQKADVWDGGHREPFVARWPSQIPAGTVRDDPICLTDLLPTFAHVAGAAHQARDGEDVLDVLTDSAARTDPANSDRTLIHHSLQGMFAVRQGRWKAIYGSGSGGFSTPHGEIDDEHGQLYDLIDDPAETTNLWNRHPDVVKRLRCELN